MSEALGWIGNVFLISAMLLLGRKWRHAFLLTAVGEVIWCASSALIGRWDMISLCVLFAILAVRNWWVWR
jgi:nicotinamide riboside transporter PnuC